MPALLLLALVLGAAFTAGCGEAPAPGDASVDARPGPAFVPAAAGAAPRPRGGASGRFQTARVTEPTWLRAAPSGRPLARVGLRTEFGSPRVLAVVGRRAGWLRVLATELPNGRSGWIPASRARLARTSVWLEVDRSDRELRLRRAHRVLRRLPVAVGRPGTPTPAGRFAVTDKLRTRGPGSPYGCCAIALTGHQTRLAPGWGGGDRLAIHGTPHPETIGAAVSLGCLRAHARDLRVLLRRVPLGARVVVRP